MVKIVRSHGDDSYGRRRVKPKTVSEAVALIDEYKDVLFPVLEKGFEHRLSSGFTYHVDVDRGRCEFGVLLDIGEARFKGEHDSDYTCYSIEGDGFDLSSRAGEGVEPSEILVASRDLADPSVVVPVPLPYFMAEQVVKYWADHGPDKLPSSMPGEWLSKYGKNLSGNLLQAMKLFEQLGEVGVGDASEEPEIMLRQNLLVMVDINGKVQVSKTGRVGTSECLALQHFRAHHKNIVGFHIHESFDDEGDRFQESLDYILTASESDLDAIRHRREPEAIFAKTDEGFPARIHVYDGDELKKQDILLKKQDGKLILVRDYTLKD